MVQGNVTFMQGIMVTLNFSSLTANGVKFVSRHQAPGVAQY